MLVIYIFLFYLSYLFYIFYFFIYFIYLLFLFYYSDIKPENIIFTFDPRINGYILKIIDFNVSGSTEDTVGKVKGFTYLFTSPEIIRHKLIHDLKCEADHNPYFDTWKNNGKIDIYSVGLIFYFLLEKLVGKKYHDHFPKFDIY